MCAMKEVTLFSDDAKSKESTKQLMQVSWLPSTQVFCFEKMMKLVVCLYVYFGFSYFLV